MKAQYASAVILLLSAVPGALSAGEVSVLRYLCISGHHHHSPSHAHICIFCFCSLSLLVVPSHLMQIKLKGAVEVGSYEDWNLIAVRKSDDTPGPSKSDDNPPGPRKSDDTPGGGKSNKDRWWYGKSNKDDDKDRSWDIASRAACKR